MFVIIVVSSTTSATYWLRVKPVPRIYIPATMFKVLDNLIVVPLLPIGLYAVAASTSVRYVRRYTTPFPLLAPGAPTKRVSLPNATVDPNLSLAVGTGLSIVDTTLKLLLESLL